MNAHSDVIICVSISEVNKTIVMLILMCKNSVKNNTRTFQLMYSSLGVYLLFS
jgi:hypothetical protein